MVRREGELVGVGAFWDQSGFKQTVVRGYHGWLKQTRPLFNLAGKAIHNAPLLPKVGEPIRFGYGAFLLTSNHAPEVYRVPFWMLCFIRHGNVVKLLDGGNDVYGRIPQHDSAVLAYFVS